MSDFLSVAGYIMHIIHNSSGPYEGLKIEGGIYLPPPPLGWNSDHDLPESGIPPVSPVPTALYYQYMHMDGIAFILNGPVLLIHLDVMPARHTV